MKRLFVFVLLFLIACSQASVREEADRLDSVELFRAMAPDTTYTEKSFSSDETDAMRELIGSECPAVSDDFVRAVYRTEGASLILYHSNDTFECVIFRPSDESTIRYEPQEEAPAEGVAAAVNGELITVEQVQQSLQALPEQSRNEEAVGQVILQLINDELLAQQATQVEVTDAQVERTRQQLLQQLQVSEEELPALLEGQGVSMQQFEEQVMRQARLSTLLRDRLLLDEINVSEEQAKEYYLENPDDFVVQEQASMRHIFISAEGRSQTEVQQRLSVVLDALNGSDFCDVEDRYSDDDGQECGTYVVPRGTIGQNLEHAAFNTPPNETVVVNTQSGVHVVQTLDVQPARAVPYGQVEGRLQNALVNNVFQQRLALYLSVLRARADIVVYLA